MHGSHSSRRNRTNLLARPPIGPAAYEPAWGELLVDPTDQLLALADLLARGLLSPEEFEREKAKVIDPPGF